MEDLGHNARNQRRYLAVLAAMNAACVGVMAAVEDHRQLLVRAVLDRVAPFNARLRPVDLSLALPFPLGLLKRDPRCADPDHSLAIERARDAALIMARFGEGASGVDVARAMRVGRDAVEALLAGRRARAGNEKIDTFIERIRREHPEWGSRAWAPSDADWEPPDDNVDSPHPHEQRVAPSGAPFYYANGHIRRWGRADQTNAKAMWHETGRWMLAGALVAEIDRHFAWGSSSTTRLHCRCASVRYWTGTRRTATPSDSRLWRVDAFRDSDFFRGYGRWPTYQLSVVDVERDAAGYASAYLDVMTWQAPADYPDSARLSTHLLVTTGHPVFDIWTPWTREMDAIIGSR